MNFENKNYYNVLGVTEGASVENIRKAYQREKFDEGRYWDTNLDEAYSVLSNYNLRREYDNYLQNVKRQVEVTPEVVTSEEVTPEVVTPEEVTPEVVTPEVVTTEVVTPEVVTPEVVTPEEVTPEVVTPEVVTPEVVTPEVVTPEVVTPEVVTPEVVTPEVVTPEEVTPEEVTPEVVTPEVVTPEEVTPEEVTPEEVTPEEVTPEEVTPEEVIDDMDEKFKIEVPEKKEKIIKAPKSMSLKKEKLLKFTTTLGGGAVGFSVLLVTALAGVALPVPTLIVGAAFTAFLSNRITNGVLKHKNYKVHKEKKVKKISEIKTKEINEIANYEKKLDEQIYDLLSKPNDNYKLAMLVERYKNHVALLEKLIDLKLSYVPKKGEVTKYKLELASLDMKLKTAKNKLEKYEEKLEEIENSKNNSIRARNIDGLNKKLREKELEKEGKSKIGIKSIEINQQKLKWKRDKKAVRYKLTNERIANLKDSVNMAWDNTRGFFKGMFTPLDSLTNIESTYTEEDERVIHR